MDNRTFLFISVVIICSLTCWFGSQYRTERYFKNNPVQKMEAQKDVNELASIMQNMPDGSRVIISSEVGKTPEYSYYQGGRLVASEKLDTSRIMSMFGVSAIEGIAKDQGIKTDTDKYGNMDVSAGEMKGMGILETLWIRIKDFIKGIALIVAIIVVLLGIGLMIPSVAPFAGAALRWIASCIPVLGSALENILGRLFYKKPLEQTIVSGQSFKDSMDATPSFEDWLRDCTSLTIQQKTLVLNELNTGPRFSEVQKADIREHFNAAHISGTDWSTQQLVKSIKNAKDL